MISIYIYDIYDLKKWLDSRPINYMQMVSKHNYYVIDSYLSINMLLRILKLHSSLLCICFLRPSHFKTWSCMACVQVIHLFYSCRSSGHLRKNRQVQASPWNCLRWFLLSTMTTIWLICATFFQWLSLADLHISLMACDFIMNFSLQAIQCDMLQQEMSGQLNHLSHCFYYTIVMYVMFCNDKYTGFSHVHVGSMCFLFLDHETYSMGLTEARLGWGMLWMSTLSIDNMSQHLLRCMFMYLLFIRYRVPWYLVVFKSFIYMMFRCVYRNNTPGFSRAKTTQRTLVELNIIFNKQTPGIPTTIKIMGVNITTIQIGSTFILMVVEA